jgi:hypothetical protein
MYKVPGTEGELSIDYVRDNGIILDIEIHTLSPVEERWHVFEKESYSIYRAATKWRSTIIAMSHKPITFLSDSQTALGQWRSLNWNPTTAKARRFAGWALKVAYLNVLNVTFAHISGTANSLADWLSRAVGLEFVKEEQIWHAITPNEEQIMPETLKDFIVNKQRECGLVDTHHKGKLIVPQEILEEVVSSIHKQFHYGRRETLLHFESHFYSPGASKVVQEVCARCPCYIAKATKATTGPGPSLAVDAPPFAHVCMDTVGPIKPQSKGNRYILTVLCRSTFYVVMIPVPNIEAPTLVATMDRIFHNYSFPETLTCDNFPSHKSSIMLKFCLDHKIRIKFIPVFSPHRNGLLERQHRVLGELLRFHFLTTSEWSEVVPKAQARINDRTLGKSPEGVRISPFKLVHGYNFRSPGMPAGMETEHNLDQLLDLIQSVELTEECNRRQRHFQTDQRVLRYAPQVDQTKSSKLNIRFKPSIIIEVIGNTTYKCRDDDGTEVICDGRALRKSAT